MSSRSLIISVVALIVALGACGGGSDSTDTADGETSTTTAAETTTTTEAETTTTEAETTTTEAETTTTEAEVEVEDDAAAASDADPVVVAYCEAAANAEAAFDSMMDFSHEGTIAAWDDQLARRNAVEVPAEIADDFTLVTSKLTEAGEIIVANEFGLIEMSEAPEIVALLESEEFEAADGRLEEYRDANCAGIEATETFEEVDPDDAIRSLLETDEGKELIVEQMLLLGLEETQASCFADEIDVDSFVALADADPAAGAEGLDPAVLGPLLATLETCEIPITAFLG